MRTTTNTYAVQGKFAPLNGLWDDEWYIIRETWQGRQIVNTELLGQFSTKEDALTRIDILSAAATLGRRGGKSTSAAKRRAARENGRKGGRPKNRK